MATEENAPIVGQLRGSLAQIARFDGATGAAAGGGEGREAVAALMECAPVAALAKELPLHALPGWSLERLAQLANGVVESWQGLVSARPQGARESRSRAHQVRPQALELCDALFSVLGYLAIALPEVASFKAANDQHLNRLKEQRDVWERTLEHFQAKFNPLLEDGSKLIVQLRRAAAETGVASQAALFDRIESRESRAARAWLVVTGVALVVTLSALAWLLVWQLPPEVESVAHPAVFQQLVSRVAIVAVLGLATAWTARIYRIRSHLAATNRHRAAALRTVELFVNSTDNQQERDIVLRAITRTIFAPGTTGFIDGKERPSTDAIASIAQALQQAR